MESSPLNFPYQFEGVLKLSNKRTDTQIKEQIPTYTNKSFNTKGKLFKVTNLGNLLYFALPF